MAIKHIESVVVGNASFPCEVRHHDDDTLTSSGEQLNYSISKKKKN